MKLNVEITNLAEFITATEVVLKKAEELQKAIQRLNTEVVLKKAEELQKAIQRLNAIELEISTSYDKEI